MTSPTTPYDACEKGGTRATSLSMVRYRGNGYAVPVAYAHHEVEVRGYVGQGVIGCGAGMISRHQRSFNKADMAFYPMHFLPLLERKIGALVQAAPLQGLGAAAGVRHPAPALTLAPRRRPNPTHWESPRC